REGGGGGRGRAGPAGGARPPDPPLDSEQPVEVLVRGQSRLEHDDAVEVGRLLADSDRLRLAQGRDGDDLDADLLVERADGGPDRRVAIAEVGAEADVGARHGRVTVTPTAPSRPPGRTSGFRTRPRTRSGSKRRSSSSATAEASASSSAYARASETSRTARATST